MQPTRSPRRRRLIAAVTLVGGLVFATAAASAAPAMHDGSFATAFFSDVDHDAIQQAFDDCKDDGWQDQTRDDGSSFENQGLCIAYFIAAAHGDNDHGDPANFVGPFDKEECKNGGWQSLSREDGSTFKNQGDCIQYANTGK